MTIFSRKSKRKSPPSPWLFEFFDQPLPHRIAVIEYAARRFGPVVKLPKAMGGYFILNDPPSIHHILLENHTNFVKQEPFYMRVRKLLGTGLLTNDTASWGSQRHLLQPFFYPQNTARFASLITQTTLNFIKRWESFAQQQKPIDLTEEMYCLMLTLAGKILFNEDLYDTSKNIVDWIICCNRYISYAPFVPPKWLPLPGNIRFRWALHHINKTVEKIIAHRRQLANPPDDLLSLILQSTDPHTQLPMDEQFIKDEVLTFLVTGHETLASTLVWIWRCLSENPTSTKIFHQELQTELAGKPPTNDDLEKLRYTKMVIQESMRLYPSIWAIARRSIEDDVINGYFVPANSPIVISTHLIHRCADYWPNPNTFDPERFAPEIHHDRPKYSYVPFGSGPRICIASNFALFEAQLIISTIAQHYALELIPQKIDLECLVTLRTHVGVKALVKKRTL